MHREVLMIVGILKEIKSEENDKEVVGLEGLWDTLLGSGCVAAVDAAAIVPPREATAPPRLREEHSEQYSGYTVTRQ